MNSSLFVCADNISRSPNVEGVLRRAFDLTGFKAKLHAPDFEHVN